jgi:pilus assembly protein CpaF
MRSLFPTRNIATFLERKNMSGDEVLEFLKRTNGDVFILAEMLKEVSANWLISAGQNGFKFVLSTAHFVTTEAMIKWLLNSKLNTSGAGDSTLTMLDIVNAIHFDVHCDFDETIGMRYIERITEIVPTGDERIYELVDVLKFDKKTHTYHIVNTLSPYTLQCIEEYSTEAEFQRFMLLFHDLGGETKI